jgi:general secretion pathway protein D
MRYISLFVLPLLLLTTSFSSYSADTPPATPSPGTRQAPAATNGQVLFNFQAVNIEAVVKTVSKLTGRNFILDPRVKGKITIISARPVSRTAAYQIFLSALKAQGFTAVSSTGGVTKIVPVGEGKQSATTSPRTRKFAGDQMVTEVIVVQNGSATQLIPLLRPLMAPTSQLSAYAPANALVITDYAQNVRRLAQVVSEIDQPVTTEVTVIPLQHASALDLAELINRLALDRSAGPAKGAAVSKVVIIPDLRTNSLLVRTGNTGQLAQLKSLVGKLDVAARRGGTTRVVYLRNAEAKKLAEVLQGLAKAGPKIAKNKGAAAESFIQADEATNSLIINATDSVYNNLRAVIEKLDIRRAQVFVEALITEIRTSKTDQLGFQWAGVGDAGGGAVAGGMVNFPSSGVGIAGVPVDPGTQANLLGLGGFSLAYLGPEIMVNGQPVRGMGALANALVDTADANILSTPNLLTLDNAEAKIVVGENVPFLTGSYAQTTGGTGTPVTPFQTIERKDIGLTLVIKPQISEGGAIKLEIQQEVSSVSQSTVTGASDLITNKRALETTVVVDDGNTVVLGGLIKDDIQRNRQKVPGLGSIPILGALFRYKSDTKVKTNLMVFLRPTIIRSPLDSHRVTTDRYQQLIERGKRFSDEQKIMMDRLRPAKPDAKSETQADPQGEEKLGPSNVGNE